MHGSGTGGARRVLGCAGGEDLHPLLTLLGGLRTDDVGAAGKVELEAVLAADLQRVGGDDAVEQREVQAAQNLLVLRMRNEAQRRAATGKGVSPERDPRGLALLARRTYSVL